MYSTTYFANFAGTKSNKNKKENCFPIPNKLEEVQEYAAPILFISIHSHYFIFDSVLSSQRRINVNLINLVKRFPTNIFYLLAKSGFDTAANEPFKI